MKSSILSFATLALVSLIQGTMTSPDVTITGLPDLSKTGQPNTTDLQKTDTPPPDSSRPHSYAVSSYPPPKSYAADSPPPKSYVADSSPKYGGAPPDSSAEHPPSPKVITSCIADKMLALTFDDGPHIYQDDLVSRLNDYNAKATFFVNGDNWNCIYSENIAASLNTTFQAGHQIASHTWRHDDLTMMSKDEMYDQMTKLDDALLKVIGVKPAYLRAPYGNVNDAVIEMANKNGQTVVNWDLDSGDIHGLSADQSKQRYTSRLQEHPKNVIALNHETHQETVEDVIPAVLEQWQQAGYRFGTLVQCLGLDDDAAYQIIQEPEERNDSWDCRN